MSITFPTATDVRATASLPTFTYDATKELLILPFFFTSSDIDPRHITAATITDSSGNVLTLVKDHEVWGVYPTPTIGGRTTALMSGKAADALPNPLVAGTVTVAATFDGALGSSSWGAHVLMCDMSAASASHPFGGASSVWVSPSQDPWPAMPSITALAGSLGITSTMCNSGSFATTSGWREEHDTTVQTGVVSQLQVREFASDTDIAVALDPNSVRSGLALQAWYREYDAAYIVSLSDATLVPGDSVTLTGQGLNAANSGAMLRLVGSTLTDALTGYTAGSATSATASLPNRPANVPYSSEDGIRHVVEVIATTSGVANQGRGTELTSHLPPPNFGRTTLESVGTTGSVCSTLPVGVTPNIGDQFEFEASKTQLGLNLVFVGNNDGTITVTGDGALVAGITCRFRYWTPTDGWSGNASDLSDWATATFGDPAPGGGETGLMSMAMLRRRRRGG